jgi:hypothetical protein
LLRREGRGRDVDSGVRRRQPNFTALVGDYGGPRVERE